MKSTYIITMHCPLNYGAILQTYALQTYLESLEIKTRIIDYRPDYIVCDQSLMYVGAEQFRRNLFTRWAYRLIKAPFKFGRIRRFKKFAKNELHLTQEFKTYDELCSANLDADYFICGSDQIWNVVSGAYKDPSYFLGFVSDNEKKISYAASGNLPITDEVIRVTFPMINNIGHLSMREDSTIKFIQPFIDKPITHVCDPVFLLDRDSWRSLYKKNSHFQPKEKYILVYPMSKGAEATISTAYNLSKELGYPLYMISASNRSDSRISRQFNVDPYTFLSLIDNAEYVITNSFHGTSFSIILEKQFWTCVAEGSNQRIMSLLGAADIEDRLLTGQDEPIVNSVVDLKQAKLKLSRYIANSKEFLKSYIYE